MLRKMGFRIYLDAENETIVQYEGKLRKKILVVLNQDCNSLTVARGFCENYSLVLNRSVFQFS